jgi:hypothetical protein
VSTQYYAVARPAGRAGFYGKIAVLVAVGAVGGFLARGVEAPRIEVGQPAAVRSVELPAMDASLGFWDVIDARPPVGRFDTPPDESATVAGVLVPPAPPYLDLAPRELAPAGAAIVELVRPARENSYEQHPEAVTAEELQRYHDAVAARAEPQGRYWDDFDGRPVAPVDEPATVAATTVEMAPAARENPYEQHPEGVSAEAQQRYQDAVAERAEAQQRYWDALEGRPVAQVDEAAVGRLDLVLAEPALTTGAAGASTTSGPWAESIAGAIAFGATFGAAPAAGPTDGTRWVVREGSQGYEMGPWPGANDGPMALLREHPHG